MANYVPSRPSFAERLGTGLGSGIGQGIANIAEHKLKQMQDKNKFNAQKETLKKLGFNDAEANFFADKDPDTIYNASVDVLKRNHPGQQQVIKDWVPDNLDDYRKAMELREQNLSQNSQPEQNTNAISQSLQRPGQMGLQDALGQIPQAPQQPSVNERLTQTQPQVQQQQPAGNSLKDFEGINLEYKGQRGKQGKSAASFEDKLAFEREKAKIKDTAAEKKAKDSEIKEADAQTKGYYEDTLSQYEASKKSDQRLNKMEKLIKKGGLPISTFYNVFKNLEESVSPTHGATAGALVGGALGSVVPGLGTVIGATAGGAIGGLISPVATILKGIQRQTSPNTEQFEKLSADFVRDAKAIYGNRLTDQDLKSFVQMIPTLSNTDAGKQAIIHNMKIFNKGAEAKAKAMKAIIRENNGHRPLNLAILVEERAKPELDRISQEFESVGPE